MTRFDDEYDPADAVDVSDLDRLGDTDDFDDPLLDEDDLALLRPPSRPKGDGGFQSPSPAKKRGKL